MAETDTALATRAPEFDAQEDLIAADVSTDTTVALKSKDTAVAPTKKRRRPARPQVDKATFKPGEIPQQTGTVWNIWYNKVCTLSL